MPLAIGASVGKYEILDRLGSGGMGEVYRARDRLLGRDVAIKILSAYFSSDPQRLRRFEQEARAASALSHPNIVTIYEIGDRGSSRYIAMELVEGKTLRALLGGGALPYKKLLAIATQVADGLAAAHEAKIVHRDLKPENIMVTRSGLVKILDFGLAKLNEAEVSDQVEACTSDSTELQTHDGLIMGTVGYMSPEQASGCSVDYRCDQFSFGVMLYELATGHRAFGRSTKVETLSAIIREEPEPIATLNPAVPAPLRWTVERCLAKDPEERYASTRDLARELKTFQVHSQDEAPASARLPLVRRAVWPVVALALLVGAMTVAYLTGESKRPATPMVRQLTFRKGWVTNARFAPDQATIVYSATWAGGPVELFTKTVDNPESRSLGVRGAGLLAISRTGELAIALNCQMSWGMCNGMLARVPLSGGAPREIVDVERADWAPDGNLAVVRAVEGRYRLEFPIGNILYESTGWISEMRVSPRGNQIAFLEHPKLLFRGGSVVVVDINAKKRVLSSGWKTLMHVAWTAGGQEVWFGANEQGAGGGISIRAVTLNGQVRDVYRAPSSLDLFDISSDGRALVGSAAPRAELITLAPGFDKERDLAWFDYSTLADLSADATMLLFYEWGEGAFGLPTVYLRRTDGSDAVRLGEGRALALSPDKKWALAVQETTPPKLILLSTGPGDQKQLPTANTAEIYWADWFRDGQRIMFAGAEPGHRARTYVHDLRSGSTTAITAEGMAGVLVSPDQQTIVAQYDADEGYYLCFVDGGAPQALEGLEDGDQPLGWSTDGRTLFVRAGGDFAVDLFRLDVATHKRTFWKRLAPADPAGKIGIGADPRGVRLTPDGKHYAFTSWGAPAELYIINGLK